MKKEERQELCAIAHVMAELHSVLNEVSNAGDSDLRLEALSEVFWRLNEGFEENIESYSQNKEDDGFGVETEKQAPRKRKENRPWFKKKEIKEEKDNDLYGGIHRI